jgi:hypothetical protein
MDGEGLNRQVSVVMNEREHFTKVVEEALDSLSEEF